MERLAQPFLANHKLLKINILSKTGGKTTLTYGDIFSNLRNLEQTVFSSLGGIFTCHSVGNAQIPTE